MCRYPVDSKAVGLVQYGRQKLYMFCILWSDRNNIRIYRTYENFKELSKLLTKKFPLEAGQVNRSERILPILKDVPVLSLSRFSTRFLDRLHLLEVYSQELLRTDAKISQCESVIQFFSPNIQDLTPSFPENSLVILRPENEHRQKDLPCPPKEYQPTTQPIVPETYICIDTFETKDTKNRSFKVQMNERLDVLIKDATGWWLVENEEKCLAWFPGPYLTKLMPSNNTSRKKSFSNDGSYYYAEKAYQAQNSDEISLTVGVVVEVIEESDIGWWLVCYNGRFGYVPSMFLKPYKNPHQNLQVAFHQERFGSTPNIFKASSNLDIKNDQGLEQRANGEGNTHKVRLGRMKSISLNGLQDLAESSQNFVQSSRQNNVYVEFFKKDVGQSGSPMTIEEPADLPEQCVFSDCWDLGTERAVTRADLVGKNERIDSGFHSESSSPRASASSENVGSTPPPVPERPSLQEIRSKCTTMTQKAVLQKHV